MFQKNISYTLALCTGVFVLSFLIGLVVLADWMEPGIAPPGGNVLPPINGSDEYQRKTGSLRLGGLTVDSYTYLATLSGKVGIGTASPTKKLDVNGAILARNGNIYVQSPSGDVITGIGELQTAINDWPGKTIYGLGWDDASEGVGILVPEGKTFGIYGAKVGGAPGDALANFAVGGNIDIGGLLKVKGDAGVSGQVLSRTATGMAWQTAAGGGVGGGGTVNYLAKFTAGNVVGNSQIFDNGANVGIGTGNPGVKLDVNGGNIRVGGFNSGTNYGAVFTPSDAGTYSWISNIGTADALQIGSGGAIGATPIISVGTSGSKEGKVGIGTSDPTQKLDVAGYVKGQTGLCIGDDCRTAWPETAVGFKIESNIKEIPGDVIWNGTQTVNCLSGYFRIACSGGTIQTGVGSDQDNEAAIVRPNSSNGCEIQWENNPKGSKTVEVYAYCVKI